MSECLTTIIDYPININVTGAPIVNVTVNQAGTQGPAGSGSNGGGVSISDVVYQSDYQLISGLKDFSSGISVSYISGDSNYNGGLIGFNGNSSVDWNNSNLNDTNGVQSVSYGIRVLRDAIQNYSVEYNNRFLRDAAQNYVLDWNNSILSGNWTKDGNYILTILDSGNIQNQINSQSKISNPLTGSGIINYLPKFTTSSGLINSVYFDSGNAGYINGGLHTSSTIFIPGLQFGDNGFAGAIYGFISPSSDGVFRIGDSAGGGSPRIILGSASTGYVSFKRNLAGLDIRNGDDTTFANLTAKNLFSSGNIYESGFLVLNTNDSGNLNSIIISTGNSLYSLITDLSGQSNLNYATISNLVLSGQSLYNNDLNLSGSLTQTGISLITRENNISGILNTIIYTTGTTIYNYITSLSGQFNTTGTNLNNLIIGLSGALNLSGINLQNSINSIAISALSVTGGNNLTGVIGISKGQNVTLLQIGNTGFSISAADGGSSITNAITGNGTLNFIPKFTSSSGLISSNIVDSGNNILISSILSITGTIGANNGVNVGNYGINSNTNINFTTQTFSGTTGTYITGMVISGTSTTISNTLNVGAFSFQTNCGQVTAFELPIATGIASGTINSYSFNVGGQTLFTLSAAYDGNSGIQNPQIVLGTSGAVSQIVINAGINATAPATTTLTLPLTEPIYGSTSSFLGTPSGWWAVALSGGQIAKIPYYY